MKTSKRLPLLGATLTVAALTSWLLWPTKEEVTTPQENTPAISFERYRLLESRTDKYVHFYENERDPTNPTKYTSKRLVDYYDWNGDGKVERIMGVFPTLNVPTTSPSLTPLQKPTKVYEPFEVVREESTKALFEKADEIQAQLRALSRETPPVYESDREKYWGNGWNKFPVQLPSK